VGKMRKECASSKARGSKQEGKKNVLGQGKAVWKSSEESLVLIRNRRERRHEKGK